MTVRTGSWRRQRLRAARLYLCADRRAGTASFLDAVLSEGVDLIQLRDKTASHDELVEASAAFREAALAHGALFILNDDPQLAAAVGADGVHVGQEDASPAMARFLAGPELVIGRSTHGIEEIDQALSEDCDYFAVGPVYATPTKEGRTPIGLDPVRYAAKVADRPWHVTGDMRPATIPEVLEAGARGIVVVRALTEAQDPAAAAARLRALLDG